MRLLVVGAGSTGGYFGGRLAQAGRDVTFLVRPARAAALRADGLRIVSAHGDAVLHPTLVQAGEITRPFDAILLAVKAFALDAAMDDMAPAVGPGTAILPVLNGMLHMQKLEARFGAAALAGCEAKIATLLDAEGRIVQLNPLQHIAYGELDGTRSPRMEAVDALMQGVGFDARLSGTIRRDMWEKWAQLASTGGITCLMRGPIGAVEAAPGGAAFALRFTEEVLAIIRAVGEAPTEAFVTGLRKMMTQPGSPLASSMYRDLQAGQRVEVDQILGDLLARGNAVGLDSPLLAAAVANLGVYQSARPA